MITAYIVYYTRCSFNNYVEKSGNVSNDESHVGSGSGVDGDGSGSGSGFVSGVDENGSGSGVDEVGSGDGLMESSLVV